MRLALLAGAAAVGTSAAAEDWEPFPTTKFVNDFGGVGLIQTPTARFAEDGQLYFGGSRVYPYERYFVTVQGTPWLEATLRYSSVDNRLYSAVPDFSGDQSYKDRGLDAKVKLFGEGRLRPALAIGARDFLGTGLFSSEYIVISKSAGPFDTSFGMGWGNMGTRGHIRNPLRLLSESFADRGGFTAGGGTLNNSYFKGRRVSLFGGISYETPLPGLTAKVEYDPNDYQTEALNNVFKVDSPINVGLDYRVRSWLHVGASFERGNKIGLKLALTTNFNRRSKAPKIDPPAPPWPLADSPKPGAAEAPADVPAAIVPDAAAAQTAATGMAPAAPANMLGEVDVDQLTMALGKQGIGLIALDHSPSRLTLYVAQARFRNVATGLGRIGRTAFSVIPPSYGAVTIVFVESGVETMAVTVYRSELEKALTPGMGSSDQLFVRTEFDEPPLALSAADYVRETKPGFYYAIRPGLRTTLGRPEQFLLYQFLMRFNAIAELSRGLSASGSLAVNVIDNFDKLRVISDSQLPHVRSDIKEYLAEGKTSMPYLQADYNFNIADGLYGHVYGGFLEEMFAGVGAEMLYRPFDANWAVGWDLTYARQRDYDQWFSLRDYKVLTGHVTGFYHFERLEVDGLVKAGRYLAKDWGATVQLSRTFKSGIRVGGFATFTDVSSREFGEGRFDKGLFITVPLDIFYVRNVRGGLGIGWKPLIRDGGQMLVIRRPLLDTTGSMTMFNMRRDWRDVLE
ncbi:YjbH domain-containing protein [Sphingoaurantiacus capsulatus]|uniref:YjbH domain-containing protein n=1 Tax=Sphingoaurantiacus capsulatus TaxID=1771310 RepID=A0ABV7XAI0_9SPHN